MPYGVSVFGTDLADRGRSGPERSGSAGIRPWELQYIRMLQRIKSANLRQRVRVRGVFRGYVILSMAIRAKLPLVIDLPVERPKYSGPRKIELQFYFGLSRLARRHRDTWIIYRVRRKMYTDSVWVIVEA